MTRRLILAAFCIAVAVTACPVPAQQPSPVQPAGVTKSLPQPFATPSTTKFAKVIGWPEGKTPKAPTGFRVNTLVQPIENPRWIYVLPNGDILVAQSRTLPKPEMTEPDPEKRKQKEEMKKGMETSKTVTGDSPNRIALLRDADKDGQAELHETFLEKLNQPFGILLLKETLYVANTDAVLAFPYQAGQRKITAAGRKICALPAGGYNNHWTRNIVANKDSTKLYVSVGSASNVGEHGMQEEERRACILEMNPDGSGLRVFASGLRNPVGMDWNPHSGVLWTAVNERDELGDDLVPDYITSVQEGTFYGWPYSYFGSHEDPRRKGERPDLVAKAIAPDLAVGAHTASLGLAFYDGQSFPKIYRGGAFIGQRGSWNRSEFAGYRVAFVSFQAGRPSGPPEDFLTGFLANDSEAYGRPVGVAVASDGSLLVADEPGNTIWRVSVAKDSR
jgi:glucose/arabinose dehydrogenase